MTCTHPAATSRQRRPGGWQPCAWIPWNSSRETDCWESGSLSLGRERIPYTTMWWGRRWSGPSARCRSRCRGACAIWPSLCRRNTPPCRAPHTGAGRAGANARICADRRHKTHSPNHWTRAPSSPGRNSRCNRGHTRPPCVASSPRATAWWRSTPLCRNSRQAGSLSRPHSQISPATGLPPKTAARGRATERGVSIRSHVSCRQCIST